MQEYQAERFRPHDWELAFRPVKGACLGRATSAPILPRLRKIPPMSAFCVEGDAGGS